MIHENVLRFRNARYLWWSLGLLALSVVLYFTQGDRQPPNGGTWQGYVLGSIGAALIVWLSLLGVRKRSYRSTLGSVQGWVSAHVYLGLALLVVATLHSAAQVNWNVHTLAYVLMCLVIFSGMYGAYVYLENPRLQTRNRAGATREALFAELFELDRQGLEIAEHCNPEVQAVVKSAIQRTVIGGGVAQQLLGRDRSKMIGYDQGGATVDNADQQPVIDLVGRIVPRAEKASEAANLQALLTLLCRRQNILRRLREDIRLQGWLKVWLYMHVPLTVALLGALSVHILTTFLYW
ncbi:MAG: hypothetical protein RIC56_13855 [Pseudomonadales bacterium]